MQGHLSLNVLTETNTLDATDRSFLQKNAGAGEMAQWVRTECFLHPPNDQSWITRTHVRKQTQGLAFVILVFFFFFKVY